MTTPTPDREFISQFGTSTVGLLIHIAGVLGDVDSNVMSVTLTPDGGSPVFSRAADHTALGTYSTVLSGDDTAAAGSYTLMWAYQISGVSKVYYTYIEIGGGGKDYDNLDQDMKDLLEQTWNRFADGFDSPEGGPVLATFFQTHFNRNRFAQLLQLAMNRLNTYSQPYQTFTLTGAGKFNTVKYGSMLEQALYIEVLKHLIRSYVEQPIVEGIGQAARLERRDYLDRWRMIWDMEEGEFVKRLGVYKMGFMGLGQPAVLVSGGAYGNWGPEVFPFAASRPTFWGAFN